MPKRCRKKLVYFSDSNYEKEKKHISKYFSDSDSETEKKHISLYRNIFVRNKQEDTSTKDIHTVKIDPSKKITVLEDRVIKPADDDTDSDNELNIFSPKRFKPTPAQIPNFQEDGGIHVSPNTGRIFQNLKKVRFSPVASPILRQSIKQNQQKNKCTSSPGAGSLSNFGDLSRSVSLNDISKDKLMKLSMLLDEQNILNYIETPPKLKCQQKDDYDSDISDSDCKTLPHLLSTSAEVYDEPRSSTISKPMIKSSSTFNSGKNDDVKGKEMYWLLQ